MTEAQARALRPGQSVHIRGHISHDGIDMLFPTPHEAVVATNSDDQVTVILADTPNIQPVHVPCELIVDHPLAQGRNLHVLELVRLQQHVAVSHDPNPQLLDHE